MVGCIIVISISNRELKEVKWMYEWVMKYRASISNRELKV